MYSINFCESPMKMWTTNHARRSGCSRMWRTCRGRKSDFGKLKPNGMLAWSNTE